MKFLIVFLAAYYPLSAQSLTARQLFYQEEAKPPAPAPKAAPKKQPAKPKPAEPSTITPAQPQVSAPSQPAPLVKNATFAETDHPLGLRYALVQVVNNIESEVSPATAFHSGDQVRVKVEANRDGYLYVISRGSSGNWKPLFPAADINNGDNRVTSRRGYRLPSPTQAFTFDEQAGQEQLFVILSAAPVKDIDSLIPGLAAPSPKTPVVPPVLSAGLDDAFVNRLRNTYSRDLIVQTVAPAQAPDSPLPENAVYVVNKSGGRVVADIKLDHK